MRRWLLLIAILAMIQVSISLPLAQAAPIVAIIAGVMVLMLVWGGSFVQWFAALTRLAPRSFAAVARLSLAGQTSDPAAMRNPPNFRVATWPALGLMPEAVIRNPVRRVFLQGVRSMFEATMDLPRSEERGREPDDVRKYAARYFPEPLLATVPAPRRDDLSAERLYEQVSVTGFYHMRPNGDGTHSLDLQFLRDYPVREGASRCGGEAVVDLSAGRFLRLVTPEDQVVTPGDPRFALESLRFRCSLFDWLTIVPHSAWSHGIVGPKFFLATHSLPEKHPMRELLRPFGFKVHENVFRAKVTVFGRAGALLGGVLALKPTSVQALVARGAYCTEIKTPAQMHMPAYLRAIVEPLYDTMLALGRRFVNEFSVSDDDPHVCDWRAFVAANIHPSFRELPLPEIIAYCLFNNSVSHHLWGHLHYGSTDPRYVSMVTRPTGATDEAGLMAVSEPLLMSILRIGVIISTRRQVVKLSGNLGVSTDDRRVKAILDEFAEKVRVVENVAPASLELDRLASSGMV
jgi:hypothetical protein